MKQRQTYTTSYPVSGLSIAKQRDLLRASFPDTNLSGAFASIARVLFLALSFFSINYIGLSQNCPVSGSHSQSTSENTYYPGTQATVSVGATSITLGAAGVGTGFNTVPIAIGDIVMIIQMQGSEISSTNSNLYGSNVAAFQGTGFLTNGNLKAGYMEFAVATNAVPIGGGTLNIASGTVYSYAYSVFGTFGQYTYQIIRVPSYYDIQLTATINTPLWNGATGGVTVISAVNQLDFNSKTINALGAGFRGGGGRQLSGASGTNNTDYVTASTINANGSKAEGFAGTPRYVSNNGVLLNTAVEGYPNGSNARGAPGNAGGGATDYDPASNDQNSGGGGGANGGNGGLGGWGWNLSGPSGGKGGLSFYQTISPYSALYSPSRLIMGGGGGSGTSNNGTGTPGSGLASSGASGGGLVVINALTIIGTGTITASGANGNNTVTIDASGGGGGGGSILIYANSGHGGITALAKGGNGGSNNPASGGATRHGPGGGGGGGIIFSNAALNVASSVALGVNGISTGTDAVTNFGSTSGTVGVLTQTFPFSQLPPKMQLCQGILPVTFLDFNASYVAANNVKVSWSTSEEVNAGYFEVQRSTDASSFMDIDQVAASQSSDQIHNYSYNDNLGAINTSVVYYRLKIVDANGKFSYSKIVSVRLGEPSTKISIYPNPASDFAVVNLYSDKQAVAMMKLMDDSGKQLLYQSYTINNGNNSLMIDKLTNLPKGIYIVQVILNNTVYNEKLIKK